MMKPWKKILSTVPMLAVLLSVMMPFPAFAANALTGSTVSANTIPETAAKTAKAETNAAEANLPLNTSVIYFGGYQWWVVGNETGGIYPQEDSLTLLAVDNDITADSNLEQTAFRNEKSNGPAGDRYTAYKGYSYRNNPDGMSAWKSPNEYAGSNLQINMETMAASLPEAERNLIRPRTFESGPSFDEWDGSQDSLPSGVVGQGIEDQRFWALSLAEFRQLPQNEIREYTSNQNTVYWLRSPATAEMAGNYIAAPPTYLSLGVHSMPINDNVTYMRPAFSLDISSVQFVTGDKNQTAAESSLADASIVPSRTTPAKLTVLDFDLALTVTADTEQAVQTGKTLTFGYENAKGGSLSCILTDADGAVKYYGKLAEITSETSSGSLSIPLSGVADGTYTLNLFSEQCNDMEYTDFCSAPVTMTVSVTSETGTVSDFRGTVLHTHSWSDAWSGDGTHHWHECTADGCDITDNSQKDGYGAHMFHWVTDREATQTESGLRHEECTVCGYAKETEEIPATGVSETPGKPVVPEEKPDPSPAPSDTVTPSVPDEPAATVQTPLAASEVRQNTVRMDSKTVLNTGAKSLKVTWGKVSGAEGYDLYVAACGKRFNGITKSVAGTVKSATFKKLAGKKLKPQKSYKVKVRAYRMVNGRKEYIANGTTLHAALTGNKTYTNAGRVQVNRKNYTLKQGKKTAIRAVIVKQKQNRRLLTKGHGPTLSYMSSNSAVASVSKNGTITAKKKGRCTIYVRALNGVCKKVGVKVK